MELGGRAEVEAGVGGIEEGVEAEAEGECEVDDGQLIYGKRVSERYGGLYIEEGDGGACADKQAPRISRSFSPL